MNYFNAVTLGKSNLIKYPLLLNQLQFIFPQVLLFKKETVSNRDYKDKLKLLKFMTPKRHARSQVYLIGNP